MENKTQSQIAIENFVNVARDVNEDVLNKGINIVQALEMVHEHSKKGKQDEAYNKILEIIGLLDSNKYNQIIDLVENVEPDDDEPLVLY